VVPDTVDVPSVGPVVDVVPPVNFTPETEYRCVPAAQVESDVVVLLVHVQLS
jgi:hypothetical protein